MTVPVEGFKRPVPPAASQWVQRANAARLPYKVYADLRTDVRSFEPAASPGDIIRRTLPPVEPSVPREEWDRELDIIREAQDATTEQVR